jgi:hypothetical protein
MKLFKTFTGENVLTFGSEYQSLLSRYSYYEVIPT